MKITPKGLGIWVWQESQCEKGDWNAIIAKCKAAGIGWIAAKSGDSDRYGNWSQAHLQEVIAICHNNGIQFGTWNYSIPSTTERQIFQIKSLFDDGIDFHILDAEIEWQTEPDAGTKAEAFMVALRASVGDVFIGHAPFAVVDYHTQFPYSGFGKYVDAAFPQAYWTEFNWSIQRTIQETDASWAKFNQLQPEAAKPVYPIGVSYGKGYGTVPGVLTADDIKAFIQHYQGLPVSLYSYDAAFSLTWALLDELASSATLAASLNAPTIASTAVVAVNLQPVPQAIPNAVSVPPIANSIVPAQSTFALPKTVPGWFDLISNLIGKIIQNLLSIKK